MTVELHSMDAQRTYHKDHTRTREQPLEPRRYASLLREGQWFKSIATELQDALLTISSVRQLLAGETLFRRGDPSDGLYCAVAGAIRIKSSNRAGKEAILAQIESPYWFGEIGLFDRLPRSHDAVAETDSHLIFVPMPALEALLQKQPLYWRDFGRLMSQKIRASFACIESMSLLPPKARLARRLLQMSKGYGERIHCRSHTLKIPQEQLAMMMGTSRQTLNHMLQDLSARNIIKVTYRELEILNFDALEHIAEIVRG